MIEQEVSTTVIKKKGAGGPGYEPAAPCALSEITLGDEDRIKTGIEEFDRVLGGGIVPGSLVLVGGDPGIGKSTLLLQVCRELSDIGESVLYISGEESTRQIKMRADRLGDFKKDMLLLCETDLTAISDIIRNKKPRIVIIDSIQTMYNEDISGTPGSVSQVRESTAVLLQLSKTLGISIFIVGHVTKEGTVAGPRILEHMVDTVLYFEGDRYAAYRILRGVKNRFGSTNEIGVYLESIRAAGAEYASGFSLSDCVRYPEAAGVWRRLKSYKSYDGSPGKEAGASSGTMRCVCKYCRRHEDC